MSVLHRFLSLVRLWSNRRSVNRRDCRSSRRFFESLEARLAMTSYFVDFSLGSDSNPGTIKQPFKTPDPLSYGGTIPLVAGDAPRLSMYIANDLFSESDGSNASIMTLIRSNTDVSSSLTVALSVNDESEVLVPATVTFPAGANTVSVAIAARDDNQNEPTRAVKIVAQAAVADRSLRAVDWVRVLQEPATDLPVITISDVSVSEGSLANGGATTASFTVRVSTTRTSFPPISVEFATADGSAHYGSDYLSRTGSVPLSPSVRTATIKVPVVADRLVERNESFFVRLSNVVNATLGDAEGKATIWNDDVNPDKQTLRVWRPNTGTFYQRNYATAVSSTIQLGLNGDVPVPADYNGDGQIDLAVWRPNNGNWYVRIGGVVQVRQWGLNGDVPVPGDYNGDGRVDLAVYRKSNGTWWAMDAMSLGKWIAIGQIAASGRDSLDIPVPGDYNGDFVTDFAVWNSGSGVWKIRDSLTGTYSQVSWGLTGDSPQSNDFDGDGKTDLAVWRPATGEWYIRESSTKTQRRVQWGLNGDWATFDRTQAGRRIIG